MVKSLFLISLLFLLHRTNTICDDIDIDDDVVDDDDDEQSLRCKL